MCQYSVSIVSNEFSNYQEIRRISKVKIDRPTEEDRKSEVDLPEPKLKHGSNHEHKNVHNEENDDKKPKILGFTEEKGFYFSKGIGLGFTSIGSAFIKTPKGGYLTSGTGVSKFGFCYDPWSN